MSRRDSGLSGIEISHREIQHHQGPLPHSSEIKAYEQTFKGAAKILFENFDEQSKHRRAMEELALKSEAQERARALVLEAEEIRRGQFLAFGCVLLFVAASCYAFYLKLQWAGSILALCGIGGIVSSFLLGRSARSDNRDNSPKSQDEIKTTPQNEDAEQGKIASPN